MKEKPSKKIKALSYGLMGVFALNMAAFVAIVPVTHDVMETTYNGNSIRITESHHFFGEQTGELPEGFPEDSFYRLPGNHMYVPWYYTVEIETPEGEHIKFRDFKRDGIYDDGTEDSDLFYIRRGEETEILDGEQEHVMWYSPEVLDDILHSEKCDVPDTDFLSQWIFPTECDE